MKTKNNILFILMFTLIISITCGLTACDNGESVDLSTYKYNSSLTNYDKTQNIVIDGSNSDEFWNTAASYHTTSQAANRDTAKYAGLAEMVDCSIDIQTKLSDDGLYIFATTDDPYVNTSGTSFFTKTGLEFYICNNDNIYNFLGNLYEVTVSADNCIKVRKREKRSSTTSYITYPMMGTKACAKVNEDIGYTVELYIPWEVLGESEKPSALRLATAMIRQSSKGTSSADYCWELLDSNTKSVLPNQPRSFAKYVQSENGETLGYEACLVKLNNVRYGVTDSQYVDSGVSATETFGSEWFFDEECTNPIGEDFTFSGGITLYSNSETINTKNYTNGRFYSKTDKMTNTPSSNVYYFEAKVKLIDYYNGDDPRFGIGLVTDSGIQKRLIIELYRTGSVRYALAFGNYSNGTSIANTWGNSYYTCVSKSSNYTLDETYTLAIFRNMDEYYYYVNGVYIGRDYNYYINSSGTYFQTIDAEEDTCCELINWYTNSQYTDIKILTDLDEIYEYIDLDDAYIEKTKISSSGWNVKSVSGYDVTLASSVTQSNTQSARFNTTEEQQLEDSYIETYITLTTPVKDQDCRVGFGIYDETDGVELFNILFDMSAKNATTAKRIIVMPKTTSNGNAWNGTSYTFATDAQPDLSKGIKFALYRQGTNLYLFINDELILTYDATKTGSYNSVAWRTFDPTHQIVYGVTGWNTSKATFNNTRIFIGSESITKRLNQLEITIQ